MPDRQLTMSTRYRMPCTCGRQLDVSATQAGETVRCSCGAEVTVPNLRELTRFEVAEAPQTKRSRRRRSWTKRQGWILLGAMIAVMALGMAALIEGTRPRLADVQELRPIEVWTIWRDVARGPDRNLTVMEQQFLQMLGIRRVWQIGLLTAAAAGLVLMAVAYAMPEPRTPQRPLPG